MSYSDEYKRSVRSASGFNLGCFLAVVLFNLMTGVWSVNLLLAMVNVNIPFLGDLLIGLFVAQISFPIAVVVLILRMFGVEI